MTNSPPSNDPEIHLPLTHGDSSEPANSKPRSTLWNGLFSTRRRALLTGTVAIVALLLAGLGVDYYDRTAKNEPLAAMTSFLQALKDGDLDKAYEYVAAETLAFHRESTLDPREFGSEWTIGDIEVVEFSRTGDRQATVSAEILASDGTGVTEEFLMHEDDDRWFVTTPYTESIHTGNSTFESLQFNGQHPETLDSSSPSWVYLLPGAYEISVPDIEFLEPQYQTVLFLGKQHSMANPMTPDATPIINGDDPVILSLFDLRDNADDDAQQRVNDYLKNCVSDTIHNHGCPISFSYDELSKATDSSLSTFHGSDITWDIDEFPKVSTQFDPGTAMDSWIGFQNQTSGRAELTVTGTDDGEPYTVTFQCSIGLRLLEPSIGRDGKLYIGPLEHSNGYVDDSTDVGDMECLEVT